MMGMYLEMMAAVLYAKLKRVGLATISQLSKQISALRYVVIVLIKDRISVTMETFKIMMDAISYARLKEAIIV